MSPSQKFLTQKYILHGEIYQAFFCPGTLKGKQNPDKPKNLGPF
jgi:hypothetical protein